MTAADQAEREAARFALAVEFRNAQVRGEALRPLARSRGVSEGVPAQYVKVLSWLEEANVPETADRFNRALRAYHSGKDARTYLTSRAPEIGAEADGRERDRLFDDALSIAAPLARSANVYSDDQEAPTTETAHPIPAPAKPATGASGGVGGDGHVDPRDSASEGDTSTTGETWISTFPWLRLAAADLFGESWWLIPIDGSPDTSRQIAEICELAASHFRTWSVGELFPGLPTNTRVEELYLFPRALHTLVRQGYRTTGDLESVTVADMFGWRQVGAGTVDAILQALARASLDPATRGGSDAAAFLVETVELDPRSFDVVSASSNHGHGARPIPSKFDAIIEDLETIAGWLAAVGRDDPVLTLTVDDATPPEVVDARNRIFTLRSTSMLDESVGPFDVAALLDEQIALLDDRATQILAARLFADSPRTLDEIGRSHGVTRERVRQVEAKARASLMESLEDGSVLAMVADSISRAIGTVKPLSVLLESMPALERVVETVGQPAWRVLDRLDDTYEIENGWCGTPTLAEARAATTTLLSELTDQYGVARLEDVGLVGSNGPDGGATASWLTKCGYIVDGGFVLTRTSSVGDYAAAVLSIAGTPLSAQEIVDRFVFDRSAGSTRNAMSTDNRFERVDRDWWALKEWGMEAYGGIRSVIRELVARSGGRARLDYIVEYITERYSVSASSVIAYAAAAPFATKDGVVQRAAEGQGSRKAPERTKRLFRRPDGWAYRVRISTDHLRGSGSVAPLAIATICNLNAGETKQLPSALGPQAIAWTGIQPSFGTIRRFLVDEDIAAESEAFLIIRDDGTFAFERARHLINDALADALTLVGAEPTTDPEAARLSLARALRIPDESPVSSIIGAYRERGDDEIADLVLAAREHLEQVGRNNESNHSAAVDEILDLL